MSVANDLASRNPVAPKARSIYSPVMRSKTRCEAAAMDGGGAIFSLLRNIAPLTAAATAGVLST
jgi:hypothetical protein